MKMEFEINPYTSDKGIPLEWGEDCILQAECKEDGIHIQANRNGLIEFAKHLLALAQEDVPEWYHIHYDDWGMLQKGSTKLTIKKIGK